MSDQNSYTSSFKRFFLELLLPMVVFTGVAGYLFAFVFEKKIILNSENCGAYKINRIITQTSPDEVPIFGSSRAENGIFPDSLGPHFFNYGLAGTKYNVTLFFMEEECRKAKPDPWMIINFDFESFRSDIGDISNYLYNINNPSIRELIGQSYKKYYSIPFLKYYGQYETYLKFYLSKKMELTKVTGKGASLEKNILLPAQFAQLVAQRRTSDNSFHCDTALKDRMFHLIDTHPDRRFVFVLSPYHSSYFDNFSNPEVANQFLNDLKAFKNVTVIDYSHRQYPDSLFLNTSHLNCKGAFRFTGELRDTLAKLGYHM